MEYVERAIELDNDTKYFLAVFCMFVLQHAETWTELMLSLNYLVAIGFPAFYR